MNKRKIRFNAVDVLIILVIAAVIFLLLYVFVFGGKKSDPVDSTIRNISYVVEINNLDSNMSDAVKTGQAVQDAVERKNIGSVSGVQCTPYRKITFDYENGKETVAEAENKVTLRITIDAEAIETDRAFKVDGCEIRVGEQYSLMFPDMYCVGYCIELSDSHQK